MQKTICITVQNSNTDMSIMHKLNCIFMRYYYK